MIVHRLEDRIPIRVGNVTLKICPLSEGIYSEVMNMKTMVGGEESVDGVRMTMHTIKCCVKDLESDVPIEYPDGTKFRLEHGTNGQLTDNSMAVLLQILGPQELTRTAADIFSMRSFQNVEVKDKRVLKTKKKQ